MALCFSIKGKPHTETVFTFEDFYNALHDSMGNDAVEALKQLWEEREETFLDDFKSDPFQYCNQECDKVYELEEHHQRIANDAIEELMEAEGRTKADKEQINRAIQILQNARYPHNYSESKPLKDKVHEAVVLLEKLDPIVTSNNYLNPKSVKPVDASIFGKALNLLREVLQ